MTNDDIGKAITDRQILDRFFEIEHELEKKNEFGSKVRFTALPDETEEAIVRLAREVEQRVALAVERRHAQMHLRSAWEHVQRANGDWTSKEEGDNLRKIVDLLMDAEERMGEEES